MGSESNHCVSWPVVLDSAGGTESCTSALKSLVGTLTEEKMSCWFALNTFRYFLTVYCPLCWVFISRKVGNTPLAP